MPLGSTPTTGPDQPRLFTSDPVHYRFRSPGGSNDIVVLGDSVPSGAGCGCRPFAPMVAHQVGTATARPTSVNNLGQDGLTTDGLLTQVRTDAPTRAALSSATAVTVTIGANDFDSSLANDGCPGGGTSCYTADLQAFPGRLDAVLRTIRSLAGPDALILVTGYWNVFLDGQVGAQQGPTYVSTSRQLTSQVNAIIARVAAADGARYVDLFSSFHGDDGSRDDTPLLAADGDHPSEAGHQLIAYVLARSISRL